MERDTLEISESQLDEPSTTRMAFLKKLGKTVAIGLGVALVPASRAFARQGSYCCRDSSCGSCGTSGYAYLCHDACSKTTCCIGCQTGWANCQYELPCTCS